MEWIALYLIAIIVIFYIALRNIKVNDDMPCYTCMDWEGGDLIVFYGAGCTKEDCQKLSHWRERPEVEKNINNIDDSGSGKTAL